MCFFPKSLAVMPLDPNAKPGSEGFSRNVATEVRAGKPEKQAIAIAYREARADALQPSPFAGPAEMRAKKMSVLAYGVDALSSRMDALAARVDAVPQELIEQVRTKLEQEHRAASIALKSLDGVGSGASSITPDAVKSSLEYKTLKQVYDTAFATLRKFNQANPPQRRSR